jgi:HPt (histidine-containing phosphotransfer) domain-containing protein
MFKIDLTYLETISGGDQLFIEEMLTMLLNTSFTEITVMKQQAEGAQWAELGSTAHKMKAPIQMLGVDPVSELILDLERSGKGQTHTESIPEKVTLLESYLTELKQQIETLISR